MTKGVWVVAFLGRPAAAGAVTVDHRAATGDHAPLARRVDIYCPKCGWEPRQKDHWICWPDCSCTWNTFDTGGVCPDCGKAYEWTQCLSCHQRSPHREWYHESGEDPVEERNQDEVPAETGA